MAPSEFEVGAKPVRELGLRNAKDSDFVLLLEQFWPPPQILWLTVGNTSNAHLKEILSKGFPSVQSLLLHGEHLIEISEAGSTVS